MALLDLKTPNAILAVVKSVPEAVRLDALHGANPAIHAELSRVTATPRRSRELNVETVEELVSWLSDPEVINAIVAGDPREAVSQAARKRLAEIDAPPPPTANSKNMAIRTQRALDKSDPVMALSDLGRSVVDWKLVGEWFAALGAQRRSALCLDLYQLAQHDNESDSARAYAVDAVVRSFTELDGKDSSRFVQHAQKRQVGASALERVDSGITDAVASFMIDGRYLGSCVTAQPITPTAVKMLLAADRFDVLAHCEAVEPEVLVEAIVSRRISGSDLAISLYHCHSARYVDALAALVTNVTRDMTHAASALEVPGISKASRAALLRCASAHTIAQVLSGQLGDEMASDEYVAFAKADDTERLTSMRDIVATLQRNHQTSTPELRTAVLALWEHSPAMLSTVMSSSWRASWVHEVCMEATAEAFDGLPNAWGVFFKAARSSSTGSAGDLLQAVKLIALEG
jgi:hypothetical protein